MNTDEWMSFQMMDIEIILGLAFLWKISAILNFPLVP